MPAGTFTAHRAQLFCRSSGAWRRPARQNAARPTVAGMSCIRPTAPWAKQPCASKPDSVAISACSNAVVHRPLPIPVWTRPRWCLMANCSLAQCQKNASRRTRAKACHGRSGCIRRHVAGRTNSAPRKKSWYWRASRLLGQQSAVHPGSSTCALRSRVQACCLGKKHDAIKPAEGRPPFERKRPVARNVMAWQWGKCPRLRSSFRPHRHAAPSAHGAQRLRPCP